MNKTSSDQQGATVERMLRWNERLVTLCAAAGPPEKIVTIEVPPLNVAVRGEWIARPTPDGPLLVAPDDRVLIVTAFSATMNTPWLWLGVGCYAEVPVYSNDPRYFVLIPPRQNYGLVVRSYSDINPRVEPGQVMLYGWSLDAAAVYGYEESFGT